MIILQKHSCFFIFRRVLQKFLFFNFLGEFYNVRILQDGDEMEKLTEKLKV